PCAPSPLRPAYCGRRCRWRRVSASPPARPSRAGATLRAGTRSWWRRSARRRLSCEHPVHEPLRVRFAAAVEAGAVEPEAAALPVLDHVIVALHVTVEPAPPFRGDALGSLGMGHLMANAAPVKLPRRPFGDKGDHLGGLGTREQEQGA